MSTNASRRYVSLVIFSPAYLQIGAHLPLSWSKKVSRGLGAASRDTEAYKAAKEGLARDEGKGQGKARAIYSAGEAKSILRGLENANRVMYSMKDSTIHFI